MQRTKASRSRLSASSSAASIPMKQHRASSVSRRCAGAASSMRCCDPVFVTRAEPRRRLCRNDFKARSARPCAVSSARCADLACSAASRHRTRARVQNEVLEHRRRRAGLMGGFATAACMIYFGDKLPTLAAVPRDGHRQHCCRRASGGSSPHCSKQNGTPTRRCSP